MIRPIQFLLLLLFLLPSCAKKTWSEPITVLSYNIRHALGVDSVLSVQRIAEVINANRPDLVALQEVDLNTSRSGNVHQMEQLAKLTEMQFAFGKSMDWDGGEYGNGVLTKFEIKDTQTYPLPGEPRSALAVTLQFDDTELVFISTHLDTDKVHRKASLPLIDQLLGNYKGKPIVLAGDFNATPNALTLAHLSKTLTNATPGLNTVPVVEPKRQIDYIMYAPEKSWKALSVSVIDEKTASDHRPVKATLKLLH